MASTPNENFLQVEGVDIGAWEKRSVLKPLNSEGIVKAINALKAKVDPSQHHEVDAAVNQAMGRFIDKRYTAAFADTVGSLDDALKRASAGETARLASVLGLSNITREGRQTYATKQGAFVDIHRTAAQEQQAEAARAQAEAARKAQVEAEAARIAREQAQHNLQANARLGGLRDFLGAQSWSKAPPTDVAKK